MPHAARTTNFRLNEDQERDLVEYALQRVDSLRVDNNNRYKADRQAWEWYNNKREERKTEGSVFMESNLVLPLTPMIAQSFIARAEDEITGLSPFFRFRPRGGSDAAKAKQYNAYFAYKFGPDGADVKGTFENAYDALFVQRCAVFKTIWRDQKAEWLDGDVKVLTDAKGKPVRKKSGLYVTEDEAEWVTQPAVAPTGETVMRNVLADDPTIVWDEAQMSFQPPPKQLLREQVIYRGAKVVLLDYDTFLCPSNAASIAEADCKGECYDKPLSWVRSMFLERPWLTWRSFVAKHRTAKAKPQTPTERNQESQETLDFDEHTKSVKLVELWIRRDVLKWGRPQEFMILIDVEHRHAVYYEFQSVLCPDHKDPYTGIAIAPHKGRWWGYNLPEMIAQFQDYADKQFNRASVRNTLNANPIGVFDPQAVEEEPDELELGTGGLYRKKPGKTIQDFIEFAVIPQLDQKTLELLEFVVRMLQLWLAVSNLSQGDYADVPENSTKYGIEASLREASKLGRRWIRRIIRGYEQILRKMVKLQANNLDEPETFELLEGDNAAMLQMTPEEIASVDLDVALVLGSQLTDLEIQAAEKALVVQQQYFATPDPMKAAVRPLLARILEALDFDNVDELLPVPVLLPAAPGEPGPGGEAPAAAPADGAVLPMGTEAVA